jgi:hypothetical protein
MEQLVMLKTFHSQKSHWFQCDEMMHPPINILVDFNEIIIKKIHYKTSILKVYPKM